ncbi:MAG: hypothetical protein BV456_08000, partial [Thermoplasmata archaeon M8B2D]
SSGDPHPTHNYGNAGNYTVTLTVTDSENDTASDTTWTYINAPPNTPIIDGPNSGKSGTLYTYTFTSTDPDGDDITEYIIDWGDGLNETITGPFISGNPQTKNHTWDEKGNYIIKAKAKDFYGAESDWASLEVTMPKNKVNQLFNRLSKKYHMNNNLQDILIEDNVTFNDYDDDVFYWDFEDGFLRGRIYRTVEKPNINIISGSYSKNKSNVTLKLEVEGEIENIGGDTSSVNIVYGFGINCSEKSYIISYMNKSCMLACYSDNRTESIDDYLVDGAFLSVNFRLNNSYETINSMEVLAIYFNEIDSVYPRFKAAFDSTTNIGYTMDIKITKPDNKLYLFNKEKLSLSIPVVIGKINIECKEILEDKEVFYEELYIDGELTATSDYLGNLIWNKLSFGKHTLKVLAFDEFGNRASDEIEVWKFF